MGRTPKYIINIGDIYDDYKCINIIQEETGQRRKKYIMKCQKCGREKAMLGSTVAYRQGTKHKSCGKGLGISYDKDFYCRWKAMRVRTSPNFWNRKNYYDRGIYNAMYKSWKEHVTIYGVHDTSLERINVDKPYSQENCCWICLDEQKGNMQKTDYFIVENVLTGEKTYCKNALQYTYGHPEIPHKYIYDLLKYNRIYKNKKFTKITKQEFEEYKKSLL
jgi:hypothetical protein